MSKNLLDYIEIEGDPTLEKVREEEKFYGYSPSQPLKLDSTFIDLYNSIVDDKVILLSERFLGHLASKKQLRSSLSIWDDLGIKLHKIKMLDSAYSDIDDGEFTITQGFLDAIRDVHPSEIPIKFNRKEKGKINGHVEKIDLTVDSGNPEDNGVLYKNIGLARLGGKITLCLYNHEITHTQLGPGKRCQSLLDNETLPILIEEIFASRIDGSSRTLEKLRNFRLLCIAKTLYNYSIIPNMAYCSRIDCDTYIKSTLQAIQLSNTYLSGNKNIQGEIQEYINKIFKEQSSVEDMLNHFNANMDEVPKYLRKLKVPR